MVKMTTAVYYRVSTEEQTIDMQKVAIDGWIRETEHVGEVKEYADVGISGYSSKRLGFKRMLADAERGKVKTVVVYKLDRLTRDALTAIRTILRFDEIGVRFISVTQPMFSNGTPFRHAIIAIFAELAQMEREMIVERVKAGLVAAKKRGVKFGAPVKVTEKVISEIVKLRKKGLSFKEIAENVGFSVGSVHKAFLNAEKST